MALNAGNGQTATVNTAVATAPSVIVYDAYNNPVPNVIVTFAVASGGGSVTGASATTNASGIATVRQLDAGHDRRRQHADGERAPASPARP